MTDPTATPTKRDPFSSKHITKEFSDDVQHVMHKVLSGQLRRHVAHDGGTLPDVADRLERTAETLETFGHREQAAQLRADADRIRTVTSVIADIIPPDPFDIQF